MRTSVGIDIAKQLHWVTALNERSEVLLNRTLPNTPAALETLIADLNALEGEVVVGIDLLGGIASLVQATLDLAGFRLVHVPGLVVNRARRATVGGENKSDPRDARVIAEQVHARRDLRVIEPERELDLEIRLLTSRRYDLVQEQTRRLARLHDLLASVHPGLEVALDLTTKGGLWFVQRFVTPLEILEAGETTLLEYQRSGWVQTAARIVRAALESARAQLVSVPGEGVIARLIRDLAGEVFATREKVARLEGEIVALLERHEDAAIIRSLPGMGTVLTAELIAQAGDFSRFGSAEALASAAGLAPVLRQSGKMRFQRRAFGGDKGLKRVFYQSAFAALKTPASRAFYDRKRREGKRHHQALIALARRRISVLWAMLRSRTVFDPARASPT